MGLPHRLGPRLDGQLAVDGNRLRLDSWRPLGRPGWRSAPPSLARDQRAATRPDNGGADDRGREQDAYNRPDIGTLTPTVMRLAMEYQGFAIAVLRRDNGLACAPGLDFILALHASAFALACWNSASLITPLSRRSASFAIWSAALAFVFTALCTYCRKAVS